MGTAITYQGRLIDANDVADGLYDFEFELYDNPGPFAAQEGNTIDINDLDVIEGQFAVELDFGSGVFDGEPRWLQIGVRPGDSNDPHAFVTLSPRIEITPVPYALMVRVPLALKGAIEGGSVVTADNSISGITSGFEAAHANDALSFAVKGSAVNTTTLGLTDPDHFTYGGYFTAEAEPQCGEFGPCSNVYGVYGEASGGDRTYGGYFRAASSGTSSYDLTYGVYGEANTGYCHYGGYFKAAGPYGHGVSSYATNTGSGTNYGGYFWAGAEAGRGVFGAAGGTNGIGVYGTSSTGTGGYFTSSSGYGLIVESGRVGIGTTDPSEDLEVNGTAKATAFVGDGSGLTNLPATPDSDWVIDRNDMYSALSGNVGIGTTEPDGKLTVEGIIKASDTVYGEDADTMGHGVHGVATYDGPLWPWGSVRCGGYFEGMGSSWGVYAKGARGVCATGGSYGGYFEAAGDTGRGVYGCADANGNVTNYGGYFEAAGEHGRSVYGHASNTGDVTNYGGYFTAAGKYGRGVYGEATGGSNIDCAGVYGYASYGRGVYGEADSGRGVYGKAIAGRGVCGESYGYKGVGVSGSASAITGYGGYFESNGCGVYASGGDLAGLFGGNVVITGTLAKGAGSFKIDHPLEPENKYLQHSFIESPDMMNVYNGNVALDENGEASVELPEYFQALNSDFRYQLTCIGGFAPVYIAEEICENRFKIGGGKKGMKVSWQVTGTRHDAYAEANRIVVEKDKSAEERGYYLHPTAYGLPEEKGIESVRNPRVSETRKVAKKGGGL